MYIGFTSNLIQRFYSHNKLTKKGYTFKYRPWHVIYIEFFETKKEAIDRDTFKLECPIALCSLCNEPVRLKFLFPDK